MMTAVNDHMEAARVKEIIADGGLEGIAAYESAFKQATEKVRNAQEALERVQREQQAAADNLKRTYEAYEKAPSDQKLSGLFQQALNAYEGAAKVVTEYSQSLNNAKSGMQEAETTLDRMRDSMMRKIREQAKEEFQAAREYAEKRKAEQAAQEAARQAEAAQEAAQPVETTAVESAMDMPTEAAQTEGNATAENGTDAPMESKRPLPQGVRMYSYDELTAKPDIKVVVLDTSAPMTRDAAVEQGIENARKVSDGADKNGAPLVFVPDLAMRVSVGRKALRHGLDRRGYANAPATSKIGEILQNAIVINEANPKIKGIEKAYILLGMAQSSEAQPLFVRFIVNKANGQVEDVAALHSLNTKKETSRSQTAQNQVSHHLPTGLNVSVADLLDGVKNLFSDSLSNV